MKKQILVIHGGDTFRTYEEYLKFLKEEKIDKYKLTRLDWKNHLPADLGADYEVLSARMPNRDNAHYAEWQIWLEKVIPLLDPNVTLVGHSLGGVFLVKYLAENKFPKKIKSLHLVAAPFDDAGSDWTLGDFTLPLKLDQVAEQVETIFIYQSSDDPVVLPANAEKYQRAFPEAILKMFADRQHFNQEHFPELVANLK